MHKKLALARVGRRRMCKKKEAKCRAFELVASYDHAAAVVPGR